MADLMPRLAATLMEARKDPDHKVIVFFVATRVVQVSSSFATANLWSLPQASLFREGKDATEGFLDFQSPASDPRRCREEEFVR